MTVKQEAFERVDRFIKQQMQATNMPGLAVALTDRERLLYVASHGLADVAAQIPVTANTLFEIGSISKSFTATALLQMQETGLVEVRAPVVRYLPWFQVPRGYTVDKQPDQEAITLHHLLSHTAGIILGTEFTTEAHYEVWALRQTEATAPPGSYFHYSNVGYKVLGLVLEEVLGQSYGEIIQERILNPLEMGSTAPVITHETRNRLAVGYEPFCDDRPAHPSHRLVPATWFETGTADGSIAATAADLAAYLRMLINRGQGPQGRILSEDSFRLMTQRVIRPPEEDEGRGAFYGYGLEIGQDDGQMLIGHDGGLVGYYSAMLADLGDGLGVVVLINGPGEPSDIARFALSVLRSAFHSGELPPLPPVPDPGRIEDAGDYAGTYRAEDRTFVLVGEGERLILEYGGERISLERRGRDRFYAAHPDFDRFLLHFGCEEGQVVEAFHGQQWYVNERYTGPTAFDHPPEWAAYGGHYRSHNPWYTNFRVVLRKGGLVLIEPGGDEETLVPLGEGVFRIGDDERCPERLRFDTVKGGQATRANLSGCDYYRTFTP